MGPLSASADLPTTCCSAPRHGLRPSSFSSRGRPAAALGLGRKAWSGAGKERRPTAMCACPLARSSSPVTPALARHRLDEDSQGRTVVGDGASLTAHYLASAAKSDQRTNPSGKAAPSRVKCVTCPAFSVWGGWGGRATQVRRQGRCSHSDSDHVWFCSMVMNSKF